MAKGRQMKGRSQGGPRRRSSKQGDSVGAYFGDAWSLAKRTAVGLNEIRKLINVEHKFYDTSSQMLTNQSGSSLSYISGITQGDNISERDGDSIKVQSLELSGCVTRDILAAGTLSEVVRIVVIRDLQNVGAAMTAADVLETLGSTFAPFQFPDYINGIDSNKRFSIVYDEMKVVDLYHPTQVFNFRSTHDCHVAYRGTTNGTASAGNGSYWAFAVTNAAATPATVYLMSRIRFTDN